MPPLEFDVRSCESCIRSNNNRPSEVPCQKALRLPAPGLIVVPSTLVAANCPCRASWADLKRAANQLPRKTGMSDWAAQLLPLVKQHHNPLDAGYLPAQGMPNNAHTFVTKDRKLLVWVQQIPNAAEAERFKQWFLANGLQTPVAEMTTAQKLAASAYLSLEHMPAEGAKVGLLEQEPRLDPSKDVLGNVEEGVADYVAEYLAKEDPYR